MTSIKRILILSLCFLICAAPSISFDAMFPAMINLPEHIKTIAIIDRSGRESKIANILEGGLTGEGIGQDRDASRKLIEGLVNQLNGAGKFWAVKTSLEMVVKPEKDQFPKILSSAHIKGICQQHGAEAVLSVEYFDSDHIGDKLEAKIGIRLYDGVSNEIIDEHSFVNSVQQTRKSDDIINLVSNFRNLNALESLSYEAGIIYAQRISPYWQRVERKYYKKAKRNKTFERGARMIEVNDWENAIVEFETCLNSKKVKVLGRANHNLAVIHEILGNHEKARDYAVEAWTKYENKESREYSNILSLRMKEIETLKSREN